MIRNKIIIGLFCLSFLNGCVQNAAFFGPAITGVSTGSIYQAGLSYGSNEAIKKATGKTTTENIKSLLNKQEIVVKEEEN